jgi:FkbH-like protein
MEKLKRKNDQKIIEKIKKYLNVLEENPSNISYWGCFKKIKKLNLNNIEIPNNLKINLALLSSFTIDPLEVYLDIESRKINLFPEFYIAGFNQFRQELLNKESYFYKFQSDLTILAVNLDSFLGDIKFDFFNLSLKSREEKIKYVIENIGKIILNFKQNSSGIMLINNFIVPSYSPYGIIDNKETLGLRGFYQKINLELENLIKKENRVYLFDIDKVAGSFGKDKIINYKLKYLASMEYSESFLPYLTKKYISYIKTLKGMTKKCIVLDLDNTLWGGIVGEDGYNGIKLNITNPGNQYIDFQKALLNLHQIGILLAINSKNNYDDAMEVIKKHPFMVLREEHFACIKINWNDKSKNILEISKELNIGLDSMVFFDDSPVECELIKQTFPSVLVVNLPSSPSLYLETLKNLNDFNVLSITEEDTKRGAMYKSRQNRIELESSLNDLNLFLKSLQIVVNIKEMDDFSLPRVSNLIMKTNQFNQTTKRYSKTEIINMSRNPHIYILTLSVKDKFGDEGIVGVIILKKNENIGTIDSFLMSCRILGRNIEKVFIYKICEIARKIGIEIVKGEYIQTKKNTFVKDFYKKIGFDLENKIDNRTIWVLNLNETKIEKPDYIRIEE